MLNEQMPPVGARMATLDNLAFAGFADSSLNASMKYFAVPPMVPDTGRFWAYIAISETTGATSVEDVFMWVCCVLRTDTAGASWGLSGKHAYLPKFILQYPLIYFSTDTLSANPEFCLFEPRTVIAVAWLP